MRGIQWEKAKKREKEIGFLGVNEYPTCVEGVMLVDGLTILVGVIPFVVHVIFSFCGFFFIISFIFKCRLCSRRPFSVRCVCISQRFSQCKVCSCPSNILVVV